MYAVNGVFQSCRACNTACDPTRRCSGPGANQCDACATTNVWNNNFCQVSRKRKRSASHHAQQTPACNVCLPTHTNTVHPHYHCPPGAMKSRQVVVNFPYSPESIERSEISQAAKYCYASLSCLLTTSQVLFRSRAKTGCAFFSCPLTTSHVPHRSRAKMDRGQTGVTTLTTQQAHSTPCAQRAALCAPTAVKFQQA